MSARTTSTRSRPRQSPLVGRGFARARIYGALACLLGYPTDERLELLRADRDVLLAAADYLQFSPAAWASVTEHVDVGRAAAWEDAYQQSFTLTFSPDVPAYEVAYASTDIFRQTETMADIAGFYRAFGVEVGGDARERVDHIAVELSFMQLLCLKEVYAKEHANSEARTICRDAQRGFLRDHLLCWAPAFAHRLEASGEPPYGAVGQLLAAWLARERSVLCVEPRRVYDEPLPPQPEPDLECPVNDVASSFIAVDDVLVEEKP